jgi:serine/threonine protein kinase
MVFVKEIGKYEIRGRIGVGGMGIVYLGYHPQLRREVAIKVLSDRFIHDQDMKERFLREARLAARLTHENITTIYDLGEDKNGNPFIVMEYLRGEDLSSLMYGKESVNLLNRLQCARQICDALHYAHSHQIVHRDIKPANIHILQDGKVKIMDFGIAKALSGDISRNVTLGIMGTMNYMSPEQFDGGNIDTRSDIFSFGVLLYELIAGIKPFEGSGLATLVRKICLEDPPKIDSEKIREVPGIEDVIMKCLEKKPEERYQRISDTRLDISAIIDNLQAGHTGADLSGIARSPSGTDSGETVTVLSGTAGKEEQFEPALSGESFPQTPAEKSQGDISLFNPDSFPLSGQQQSRTENKPIVKPKIARFLIVAVVLLTVVIFSLIILNSGDPNIESSHTSIPSPEADKMVATGPPQSLLNAKRSAEQSRDEAKAAGAKQYAGETFEDAEKLLEKAESEITNGNFVAAESLLFTADNTYRRLINTANSHVAELRNRADNARNRAIQAKQGARDALAESSTSFVSAEKEYQTAGTLWQQQNYEAAQQHFVSAGRLYEKAIRDKKQSDASEAESEQLLASANNLARDAAKARNGAAAKGAENFAGEAYQLGLKKETTGKEEINTRNFSAAANAFEEAVQLFERAAWETIQYENARNLYNQGYYALSIDVIQAILADVPYAGKNQQAFAFLLEVEEAKNLRNEALARAGKTAESGELAAALDILTVLPDRDKDHSDVVDLRKDILSRDLSAPEIFHSPADGYDGKEAIIIKANVRDNIEVTEVILVYKIKSDKNVRQTKMFNVEKDSYSASIGVEQHNGKEVKYYFIARDICANEATLYAKKNREFKLSRNQLMVIPSPP